VFAKKIYDGQSSKRKEIKSKCPTLVCEGEIWIRKKEEVSENKRG